MLVANIVNPKLRNQVETGAWISRGLHALGHDVRSTDDRTACGDITVVHGPNYAMRHAPGMVIWLDRCWYGSTDEWVSLGWRVDSHTRHYCKGEPGRLYRHIQEGYVTVEKPRTHGGTIVLDDYAQSLRTAPGDKYRPHPARGHSDETLAQAMHGYRRAICGAGTCAAQARLAGLDVVCHDRHNVVHGEGRQAWAEALAWKQWHMTEIISGYAIEALLYEMADVPLH